MKAFIESSHTLQRNVCIMMIDNYILDIKSVFYHSILPMAETNNQPTSPDAPPLPENPPAARQLSPAQKVYIQLQDALKDSEIYKNDEKYQQKTNDSLAELGLAHNRVQKVLSDSHNPVELAAAYRKYNDQLQYILEEGQEPGRKRDKKQEEVSQENKTYDKATDEAEKQLNSYIQDIRKLQGEFSNAGKTLEEGLKGNSEYTGANAALIKWTEAQLKTGVVNRKLAEEQLAGLKMIDREIARTAEMLGAYRDGKAIPARQQDTPEDSKLLKPVHNPPPPPLPATANPQPPAEDVTTPPTYTDQVIEATEGGKKPIPLPKKGLPAPSPLPTDQQPDNPSNKQGSSQDSGKPNADSGDGAGGSGTNSGANGSSKDGQERSISNDQASTSEIEQDRQHQIARNLEQAISQAKNTYIQLRSDTPEEAAGKEFDQHIKPNILSSPAPIAMAANAERGFIAQHNAKLAEADMLATKQQQQEKDGLAVPKKYNSIAALMDGILGQEVTQIGRKMNKTVSLDQAELNQNQIAMVSSVPIEQSKSQERGGQNIMPRSTPA